MTPTWTHCAEITSKIAILGETLTRKTEKSCQNIDFILSEIVQKLNLHIIINIITWFSSFFEYCVTRVGGALVNLLHLSLLIDIFELIFFKLNSFLWLRIFIFFICGWCFVQNSRKSGIYVCCKYVYLVIVFFYQFEQMIRPNDTMQDKILSCQKGSSFPLLFLSYWGPRRDQFSRCNFRTRMVFALYVCVNHTLR